MRSDDETRTLEQELTTGQSETTPVIAIGAVVVAIGVLVAVALALALLAYVLS